MAYGYVCDTCLDGQVVSDTCDACGERHCQECAPCDAALEQP